jgi:hypothetical protein
MRVMDFWKREQELLDENWVFIDLLDLLHQMDFDVLRCVCAKPGGSALRADGRDGRFAEQPRHCREFPRRAAGRCSLC